MVQLPSGVDADLSLTDASGGATTALGLVEAEVTGRLASSVAVVEAAGAAVRIRVEPGAVVEGIWRVARAQSADLVVVGSDLAQGIRRLLGTSFTEAVLHEATCPVVVVKADRTQEEPKPLESLKQLVAEAMA